MASYSRDTLAPLLAPLAVAMVLLFSQLFRVIIGAGLAPKGSAHL